MIQRDHISCKHFCDFFLQLYGRYTLFIMANKKNLLKRKRSTKNMVTKTLSQKRSKKPR